MQLLTYFPKLRERGEQHGNYVKLLQFNGRVEQGMCCSSSSPPAGRQGTVDLKHSFRQSLMITCSDLAVLRSKAEGRDIFFPYPCPVYRIAVPSMD